MPWQVFLIFIGGGLGSVLCYFMQGWFQYLAPKSQFPMGTLMVNLIGCFLIGFLAEFLGTYKLNPNYRFALIIGLLGGYTTFSTFGYEALNLSETKQYFLASLYVVLSVAVGLIAVWVGKQIVRVI